MPKSKSRRKKNGTPRGPTPPRNGSPGVRASSDTAAVRRFFALDDPNPNFPVCFRSPFGGDPQLFSFPDFVAGGQCTAITTRKKRCGNPVWDQGQVSPYNETVVAGLLVTYYGPLPDSMAQQFFAQRCRVHNNAAALAFCEPEWSPFTVEHHRAHYS